MKQLVCLILMMAMLCGCACAEILTTGNVNLRVGPGLDYDIVTAVPAGDSLEYMGGVSVDNRGVEWYSVIYGGQECWISSKYSVLVGEEEPQGEMQFVFDLEGEAVEVSGYFMQDLVTSAQEMELTNYEEVPSESPNCYSNDQLTFAGYEEVTYIGLFGSGYMIYGCEVGEDIEIAAGMLEGAGLTLSRKLDGCYVFEHPANELSFVGVDGFDSCINVTYDENGAVTGFDWSAYTG